MSRTICVEEIRAANRHARNIITWSLGEWKRVSAIFKHENPKCIHCGRPTQVPHHREDIPYGTPEYLDLSDCDPMCLSCHYAYDRGLIICPDCLEHYMVPDNPRGHCQYCMTAEEKESIEVSKYHWNNVRRELSHAAYQKTKINRVAYHAGQGVEDA